MYLVVFDSDNFETDCTSKKIALFDLSAISTCI